MSQCQQNKQTEQPKRTNHLKFLSIKSIIRNKKVIVKKTVPATTYYTRHTNTFSTCQLNSNMIELKKDDNCTQRGYSNKGNNNNNNTNIVTIKFGEDKSHLHKLSDQKIKRKFTNTFNVIGDQFKKNSYHVQARPHMGSVQDTLIIQPLKKIQSHFGWDKRKGFYNYMLITKKSRKGTRDYIAGHETVNDFRQLGKQLAQQQLQNKKKSFSKPNRTSASFMPIPYHIRQSQQHQIQIKLQQQQQNKTISHDQIQKFQKYQSKIEKYEKPEKIQKIPKELDQNEKIQKYKQKQLNEALLKQYKQILPFRKPSNKKDYFVFGMSQKTNQPQNKVQLYRDYLWKINYSNGLYVYTPENIQSSYKAYIGFGNNSCMLKSILRRRSWWTIIQSNTQLESCQFVWTQLKINSFFKNQIVRPQQSLKTYDIQNKQLATQKQQQQQQINTIAHAKILNQKDLKNWLIHAKRHIKSQQKLTQQTYIKRVKLYGKKQINKIMDSQKIKIHNHLQFNYYLGNKKALFYNVKRLCQYRNQNPFQYIPVTFHISKGMQDIVYEKFLAHYKKLQDLKKLDKNFKNIWICKPGENTNRGNGISVCSSIDDVRHRLRGKQKNGDGKPRTFILQKYIEKPFLYKNRKFDIRHYMLLTCFNGNLKAYWFQQGYVRTSSSIFTLKNSNDLMIHLTNDAVQKKADTYGKHEKGNKVSYEDFQKYLDANYKKKYDFLGKTLKKMKKIALTAVEATYFLLDPNRRQHNFQLIGLDFMIDQNFKPWLIEANTNPCLQLSSPLLQKLIPSVIQQTFRICVDPFFPPPQNCSIKNRFFGQNALLENRFQLIFDESIDGNKIKNLIRQKQKTSSQYNDLIGKVQQDNQLFEDDGNQNWEQKNTN